VTFASILVFIGYFCLCIRSLLYASGQSAGMFVFIGTGMFVFMGTGMFVFIGQFYFVFYFRSNLPLY